MKSNPLQLSRRIIIILALHFALAEAAFHFCYPALKSYNSEMWRYGRFLKRRSQIPKVGHEHVPNARGNFYGVEIKTNSEGWRDREYSVQPPSGKKRIMVLGDSLTLGWGVKEEDAYPRQLEVLLKNSGVEAEVINTGVGNYNSLMEVNSFLARGARYKPDTIVVGYYINDAEVIEHHQNKALSLLEQTYTYALLSDRFLNVKMALTPSSHYQQYYSRLYTPGARGLDEITLAFHRLSTYANENSVKVLVVNIPEMHGFKPYPFPEVQRFLDRKSRETGIKVVDLLPYFEELTPSTLWVSNEDAHPNRLGQSIIARGIADQLLNQVDSTKQTILARTER